MRIMYRKEQQMGAYALVVGVVVVVVLVALMFISDPFGDDGVEHIVLIEGSPIVFSELKHEELRDPKKRTENRDAQ